MVVPSRQTAATELVLPSREQCFGPKGGALNPEGWGRRPVYSFQAPPSRATQALAAICRLVPASAPTHQVFIAQEAERWVSIASKQHALTDLASPLKR